MLSILKIIKFDNLLIIAIAQLCIRYGLFEPFGIAITLNGFGIFLLILATLSIAAAGNVIIHLNDDEKTNEKLGNRLFIIFNVIGVLLGFYLSNLIGRPGFAVLFIIVSGIFYMYATYLKEILVVKNIIIGVLATLSILAIGIFDLLPAITEKNRESQTVIFSIIFDYSVFAFLIIVLREILKDCLNVDKDHNMGLKTIPIVLGKERTIKLIGILAVLPIAAVIYYIYTYLFSNSLAVVAVLALIVAPLIFFIIKSFTAETDKQLRLLKHLLRIVLLITAISLLMYQYLLK
ncbi:geranylgeranylglycerol-phosphate geranylgeranyltransferase [Aquimarina spongiae]|uniref:4-hydroxybenzoate polyprenyltransferase n=1 Tax=Aquimarina spongiae TaxID=570521 RepID=A0A1M6A9T0_9FLAO|nr:geranylgeranylglycerol-phosphate geranylgeranyltransferase [Aquimarina spongiae]SHI33284.1 4-hydroxybenzoate polyprenyltransferase [Aquimarina spongiae]